MDSPIATQIEEPRAGSIEIEGLDRRIRIAYLESGPPGGELVVLIHGFPDNARTWGSQMAALAGAGYRVVAPFLRGYPPSEIPSPPRPRDFTQAVLAADIAALIRGLGRERAKVVGHDWGAVVTYAVARNHPEVVDKVVTLGFPPVALALRWTLASPKEVIRSFHWFLAQVPVVAEWVFSRGSYWLIANRWAAWSTRRPDPAHVDDIRRTLRQSAELHGDERALSAALGYYRGGLRRLFDQLRGQPEDDGDRKIGAPTLAIFGADDPRHVLAEPAASYFEEGAYQRPVILDGAHHFVHLDQPAEVNRLVLDFFRA